MGTDPEHIPMLVEALTENNVDVAIGSRLLDKNSNSPGYRKTGIKIITSAFNFGTDFKVTDCFTHASVSTKNNSICHITITKIIDN